MATKGSTPTNVIPGVVPEARVEGGRDPVKPPGYRRQLSWIPPEPATLSGVSISLNRLGKQHVAWMAVFTAMTGWLW